MASIQHVEKHDQPLSAIHLFKVDLVIRILAFAAALAAPILMVTANQIVLLDVPSSPLPQAHDAKYTYAPAFIYFVAAMSIACVYILVTAGVSALSMSKGLSHANLLLILAYFDVVMFGVVASATGAGSSIAYVGLKGESHAGWMRECNMYGKYCRHIGSSLLVSSLTSVLLLLLVGISISSLYRRSEALFHGLSSKF